MSTTRVFAARLVGCSVFDPNGDRVGKVRDVLAIHFGRPVRIAVEVGAVRGTTVAAVRSREQADALAQAQSTLEGDAFVRTLIDTFDGTIVPDSIQPIGPHALPGESR